MLFSILFLGMFLNTAPNLDALQWHKRVLVILATAETDPRFQRQTAILSSHAPALGEREIEVFTLLGNSAESRTLRSKLRVESPGFEIVLVGKDGGIKIRQNEPVGAEELFRVIDAMPMRQAEMKGKK